MSSDLDRWARIIWKYHLLHQAVRPADVLLLLGGHDLRDPAYAADLFLKGLAPVIVVTGGIAHVGDLLETGWNEPEADVFARTLIAKGVPESCILLEREAKNTGDNFRLSRRVLEQKGIPFKRVLIVTKPYMERRAYMTGKKEWPDVDLIVTSQPLSFDEYVSGDISKDTVINLMIGDLQRIDVYGRRGFQIPQEIPKDVREAMEQLKRLGYTKHLIAE